MRWIILALSLGASITSIIHGVFMLFGSLSMGSAPEGASAILLASLPIVSAVSALIGGIVAFTPSRWGASFLFLATVLCAFAPKEFWIYGGIYFVGAVFCIFLRPNDGYADYDYDFDYDDEDRDRRGPYDDEDDDLDDDLDRRMERRSLASRPAQSRPVATPDAQRVRQRVSKVCPACLATVATEHRFCPYCGEPLHVPTRAPQEPIVPERPVEERSVEPIPTSLEPQPSSWPQDEQDVHEPLAARAAPLSIVEPALSREASLTSAEDEEGSFGYTEHPRPSSTRKVVVRPERDGDAPPRRPVDIEPDTSYQEFKRYARQGKRRRRSTGRRILSLLLLFLAVGGALWSLLGLRKLPEEELPRELQPVDTPPAKSEDIVLAVSEGTTDVVEEGLPHFTPDLTLRRGVVTGDKVRLREDHSTSSKELGRLTLGTQIELLDVWSDQRYPWYRLRSQGRTGWMRGDYVQPLGGALPSGYANALLASFGRDRAAMVDRLGAPSKEQGDVTEWNGMSARFDGGEIVQLRLSAARHELINGLKTGIGKAALFQILGYPASLSQKQLRYGEGSTGVTIQLNKDDIVQTITIDRIR